MFQCIQQSLFASPDSPVIREDERRGISLLRSVVHSNDRAKVDVSLKSFRIVGESGLRYLVRPGSGAHGTRFTVWGFGNQGSDANRWDHEALQMLEDKQAEFDKAMRDEQQEFNDDMAALSKMVANYSSRRVEWVVGVGA